MSEPPPQAMPAATAGAITPASLESLEIIAIDALQGIEAMADIAARECDRGRGRVNARLVVRMLGEIAFRATRPSTPFSRQSLRHRWPKPPCAPQAAPSR